MKQNKTQPTDQAVEKYIDAIENAQSREDSRLLNSIFVELTHEQPVMWGPSIVGYGQYHYKYDSGREGDSLRVGFSARKGALVLYGLRGVDGNEELLKTLGAKEQGKGCIYVKNLSSVNIDVLRQMIVNAYSNTHS